MLIHGSESSIASQLSAIQKYPGLNKVYTAKSDHIDNSFGESVAKVASDLISKNGYTQVIAPSSGFGKDVMPQIGGHLDLQAITDIVEIKDGGAKFVRPIYAGNALCTVSTKDNIKLLTVRGTNFEKVKPGDAENGYDVEDIAGVDGMTANGKWIEDMVSKSEMADLTSAKYVVSGGRALKSGENF